jgi:hypothetical protein
MNLVRITCHLEVLNYFILLLRDNSHQIGYDGLCANPDRLG